MTNAQFETGFLFSKAAEVICNKNGDGEHILGAADSKCQCEKKP